MYELDFQEINQNPLISNSENKTKNANNEILVMTSNGYKTIEKITIEDKVLTHSESFESVKFNKIAFKEKLLNIKIMGSEAIIVANEQKFLVRKMKKVYSSEKRNLVRTWEEPNWIEAIELSKESFLGVPINQKSRLPEWKGVIKVVNQHQQKITNELEVLFKVSEFWWVIGRYLGDGWTTLHKRKNRKNSYIYRTIICCAKNEIDELEKVVKKLFPYTKVEERTVYKLHISNQELYEYLQQFGRKAHNKRLTNHILDLPNSLIKSFLDGYLSADGSYIESKDKYKITSTSKELIYGIGPQRYWLTTFHYSYLYIYTLRLLL